MKLLFYYFFSNQFKSRNENDWCVFCSPALKCIIPFFFLYHSISFDLIRFVDIVVGTTSAAAVLSNKLLLNVVAAANIFIRFVNFSLVFSFIFYSPIVNINQ